MQGASTKSEFWGKLVRQFSVSLFFFEQKVNTGRLNMNGQQESTHKAHLKQSYSKCLTTWCKGS